MSRREHSPWYARGLRFECHQCHNCCRGAQPGWVYASPTELRRIARFVKLDLVQLRSRFVRKDENGETVLRLRSNGDCVFWRDGCTIYPVRPRQCRSFPFWAENLDSPEAWESLKHFCHGIDRGKLYHIDDIRGVFKGRATG